MGPDDRLTIGALARRTGLTTSAIRFYEEKGLVTPRRDAGGRRRFARSDIRRLSFVILAQRLGLSLKAIQTELDALPQGRAPTRADWAGVSAAIRDALSARIAALERMRDKLDGCIGCGCLSLDVCALYNPDDQAAAAGPGPAFILGHTQASPGAE